MTTLDYRKRIIDAETRDVDETRQKEIVREFRKTISEAHGRKHAMTIAREIGEQFNISAFTVLHWDSIHGR